MSILIFNSNTSLNHLYDNVLKKHHGQLFSRKDDLTHENLSKYSPNYIYFPHWSYIIPKSVFSNYNCILFHMTDLPYGRGGSPLQNLIVRGWSNTKISAIKVEKQIDGGDIYLKCELCLLGRAEEIYIRCAQVVIEMIDEITSKNILPYPQNGEIVEFKRRTPEQSDLSQLNSLNQVYDYIRMLDAPDYPNAFLETDNFKLEFSRATYHADKSIKADVIIKLKP
jgi:methionyl-tRNA formyltransferase